MKTPDFQRRARIAPATLLLFAQLVLGQGGARAEVVTLDASAPPAAPAALSFPVGGKSPDGQEWSVNSRYFTLDGKPYIPVMGEFHFSRYPAAEWENEILKMKAGGINIVACYIIWIHHEETEGQFDWSGQKDLRTFVQLCAKHGMYVWVRIGPWDHAEVRNGGLPDWLVQKVRAVRTNDPAYLDGVTQFYNQIGAQLKGLMWKDGGPVIGSQIENEFKGSAGAIAHLQQLQTLARAAGVDVPFYTVTGWDAAAFPPAGFLPVFGGYTEQFWSNSKSELPPNVNFFFTNIRAEDNVGPNLQPKNPRYDDKFTGFPLLTAEMGGGMAIAYHRRPLMQADDSTAAALVKLGAGINLVGYYMYHGGTNPDGKTPLQEEQAQPDGRGYNDMEAKSYDFQAPLGEFGQFHPTFFSLKALHLFLADFGPLLAPMTTNFADQQPTATSDKTTARVTARTDGKAAFIFINNYERNYALAEHRDFQVALKLPGETVTVPRTPVVIPNGYYGIWPVNLDLGAGVVVQSASVEPLCKISAPDTFVFFASPGVDPQFAFAGQVLIDSASGTVRHEAGGTQLVDFKPGTGVILLRSATTGAKTIQLVVLTREQALNLYKAPLAGRDRLFLSNAGLFFDGNAVHLNSRHPADLKVGIYPALSPAVGAKVADFHPAGADGIFQEFTTTVETSAATVTWTPVKPAGASEAAKLGSKKNLAEPEQADFERAAVFSLKLPLVVPGMGRARPVLVVNYQGDVARIYAGGRLVDDNFYKGPAWEIGLWRFTPEELAQGLDLKILPLRQDTNIFLEKSARPAFDGGGDVLNIKDLSIVWDYEAVLNAAP